MTSLFPHRALIWVVSLGLIALGSGPSTANINTIGDEFRVNARTDFDQNRSDVAPFGNGGFVIVWQSANQDAAGARGVFGRRFDLQNSPTTGEFQVNLVSSGDQKYPAISGESGGRFVIVWQSDLIDGELEAVMARLYEDTGDPIDVPFQVNTFTGGSQARPDVSMAPNGRFVVVWDSTSFVDSQDGDSSGIFAQRFRPNGNALGDEFQINTHTTGSQYGARVATHDNGDFVVVWNDASGKDGESFGIFGQRFNSEGNTLGDEFQVNTFTTGSQAFPSVGTFSDGSFVVAWTSYAGQDGDGTGVFGQLFDGDGIPTGEEFQINAFTTGAQRRVTVTPRNDDFFIATWSDDSADGDGDATMSRRFRVSDLATRREFMINSHTPSDQKPSAAGFVLDDEFIVTWTSTNQDQNGDGVFARRLEINRSSTTTSSSSSTTSTTLIDRPCGDPVVDGNFGFARAVTATDALFVLRAAVRIEQCADCVCDVNSENGVTATDALLLLQFAVGQSVQLNCPACS